MSGELASVPQWMPLAALIGALAIVFLTVRGWALHLANMIAFGAYYSIVGLPGGWWNLVPIALGAWPIGLAVREWMSADTDSTAVTLGEPA